MLTRVVQIQRAIYLYVVYIQLVAV